VSASLRPTVAAPPPPVGPPHLWLTAGATRVPLGFVAEGATVFLVARDRAAQWPVESLRRGTVRLELPEGTRDGAIRLVTDPGERERVLDRFRAEYGARQFERWYAHPARVLRVDLRAEGAGDTGPAPYIDWLTAEFDNVADDYDRHITGNRMNLLLRERSLAQLRRLFPSPHHLLEVGCGSGMETLPMLEAGHTIVAVDVSERMLAVVAAKARRAGRSEQLRTVHLRAAELSQLVRSDGPRSFDGAYSTYGALNCEPDLAPVVAAFAELLAPGRTLLAGIYNRWCAAELLGYSLTLQTGRAFGRRRNPIPVGASRFCIDVFAYSAWEFAHRFAPAFRARSVEGVPVILPPSDLTQYAERFARRFPTLARWDAAVGRRWPFQFLGDHFLMTLIRADRPTAS
jgi:SAM-dependent methyltransferase